MCRGLGKPCVAGVPIEIDNAEANLDYISGEVVKKHEAITIDGGSGAVYRGEVSLTSVDMQADPYLMRYASMVWAVNPDDYVEDGLGTLWRLRDTIRDRSVPGFFRPIFSLPKSLTKFTRPRVDDAKYVSFIQPPDATTHYILSKMHSCEDADTAAVVWGIMDNLLRLLHNEVGIGNHHLTIRPLIDPERSFINMQTQRVLSRGAESTFQLVGLECFGINRYLRNHLDWSCVQWWTIVRLLGPEPKCFWLLDRTNPRGESLTPGRREFVAFLVIRDGRFLTILEAREWYNELRKRELGWDWYRENNTSWRQVESTLQCVHRRQPADQTMLTKCQRIGLLTRDLQLSPVGSSILREQTAASRRLITFAGREIRDE